MKLWICEKPDQAKTLANVLGKSGTGKGYIKTNDGNVTWCYGHMLQLRPPEYYHPDLKPWSFNKLPVIPDRWEVHLPKTKDPDFDKVRKNQMSNIKSLLRDAKIVVIATDGDREGESIGREVLDFHGYQGDIQRLWYSALDDVTIKRALAKILKGSETAPLYDAARARSRADWLLGMNLTIGATTVLGNGGGVLSIGRVQTPTLALVVRRDLAIEKFTSRNFFELVADVTAGSEKIKLRHSRPSSPEDLRIFDESKAKELAADVEGSSDKLEVTTEEKKQGPKKLFSLSGLQKEVNAKWGWSADKAVKVAQALYEKHKVTSYPRSDCVYLPNEQETDIVEILGHLKGIEDLAKHVPASPKIRKGVFNTAKITAHHAIIPTTKAADLAAMSADEKKAYLLIASHYIAALMGDYVYEQTTVSMTVKDLLFKTTGKVDIESGWRSLLGNKDTDSKDEGEKILPAVKHGQDALMNSVKTDTKATKAPSRYTEGTLIADMASVAKFVEDPEQKKRLKETSGIGTEATRASILEVLKARKFIEVKGKQLISSSNGRKLIESLPDRLSDPAETAFWEDRLNDIAEGKSAAHFFIKEIEAHVSEQLEMLKAVSETGVRIGAAKAPSERMIAAAKAIAFAKALTLPPGYSESFGVCKTFLEQNKNFLEELKSKPTEKMITFAEKIAADSDSELPDLCRTDRQACSDFIEKNRANLKASLPSEKQLKYARSLAKAAKIELPEESANSSIECSKFIEANKTSGRRSSRSGRKKTSTKRTASDLLKASA